MADRIPAGLSARRRGRKFGLTVGLAFLFLAAVMLWRSRQLAAAVCTALGVGLIMGAVLAPRALLPVERAWMALAHAISRVTTPLAMGVVYYAVLTPTGLIMRLAGHNPLHVPKDDTTSWVAHRPSDMNHQF